MTRMSTFARYTDRGPIQFEPGASPFARLQPKRFISRAIFYASRALLYVLLYALVAAIILLANHTTQAGQAAEADDQYDVAAGHYAQKQWELAAEEFNTFLESFPKHPKAAQGVYYLGETFLQFGRLEEAQKRFDQYLREYPQGKFRRAAAFRSAETAYLSGNNTLAKQRLQDFQTKNPKDNLGAFVLPYLGNIALAENDANAAAKAFQAALSQFPHGQLQDNCRLGLARTLAQQGKSDEAKKIFQAIAAKPASPLAPEARYRLGLLQFTNKQYAQAAKTLQPLVENSSPQGHPHNSHWQPHARLCLALVWRKLGQTEKSHDLLTKIVAASKGPALKDTAAKNGPRLDIDARYWLAIEHKEADRWKPAANALTKLAKECPTGHQLLPAINFHAGDALLRDGRSDAASKHFEAVLALPKADNHWADDAARAMVQVALRAKNHEKLDRHADAFSKRFAKNPLRNDVDQMRARSLLERHNFQKTLDTIRPVVATAKGPVKQDALLVEASALVGLKRFEDAIRPLQAYLQAATTVESAPEALSKDTKHKILALGQLAICHARSGNIDEAKKCHARLMDEHIDHELFAPTVAELAEDAFSSENYDWSAELFQWLVDESGRKEFETVGLNGLAWSQLEQKQNSLACSTFERLLHKDPDPELAAEAAFVRGRILESMARLDGALPMYDRVIQHHADSPQHPKALLAAARLQTRLSNLQEAAKLYGRLAADYPSATNLDVVLYEWSWTLRDLDQQEKSNSLFERVHREYPDSRLWADASYRLAAEAFDKGDTQRAGELIERILAAGNKPAAFAHALALKWQIAALEERWDDVGKSARQLLGECPKSDMRLVAEYWVAESTYRRGEYDLAAKRFDELADKTADNTAAWLPMVSLRRAQIFVHQNQWSQALVLAAKMPQRFPEFEQQHEVDYLLGRCFARRAEFEKARQAYLRVTRSPHGAKSETAAMAQWMIGETYFHQKDFRSAAKAYHRVEILYAYPKWQAAALLQAAKCRQHLGQTREAANLFRRVIDKYPETQFVEEAGRRLRTTKR